MADLVALLPEQVSFLDLKKASYALEAKMKFDPVKQTLNFRAAQLNIRPGTEIRNFPGVLLQSATRADAQPLKLNVGGATAANQWTNLPTIVNYEDAKELNEVEHTEMAFSRASKKFTW